MFYNIQALRGVAALAVVLAHAGTIFGAPVLGFGVAGVDLFFVISGFIIAHTTFRPISPAAFLAKRAARVVPLYWLLTLCVAAVAFAAPQLLQNTEANPVDLLQSLFFIPYEKASGVVQPMLFVGWTLNYEMFFYGLFGLCLLARDRAAALCASVIVLLATAGLVFDPTSVLGRFYTSPITLEFALGIGIALARRDGWTMRARPAAMVLLTGLALLVLGSAFGTDVTRAWTLGIPSAVIVAAALSLEVSGKKASGTAVQMFGAASYALYLSHPFVLAGVGAVGRRLSVPEPATAIAAVSLASVVAIALYLCVERPMTLWLSSALRVRSRPPRLAATSR